MDGGEADASPADASTCRSEDCNGTDDDCDGRIDEGLDTRRFRDTDGDGFGDPESPIEGCAELPGTVLDGQDCDDGRADVSPGTEEVCGDGLDNDCNGTADCDDMRCACVGPSSFYIGSPPDEAGREGDEVRTAVELTHGLEVDRTEVTQREWNALMGAQREDPSGCPECPVIAVSWYEAIELANARSAERGLEPCYELTGCTGVLGRGCSNSIYGCGGAPHREPDAYRCDTVTFVGLACSGYRLPTEAEWEFAARAGSTGPWPLEPGASLSDIAWCPSSGVHGPQPAGQLEANAFGLHDMHGNVYEWVMDPYEEYPDGPLVDPLAWSSGSEVGNVIRGGSWALEDRHCRSANRGRRPRAYRERTLGFRLVRTVP